MKSDAGNNFIKKQFLLMLPMGIWVVYLVIHIILRQHQETIIYAGFLVFICQVGLDLMIILLTFFLWKRTTGPEKPIFALFSISFLMLAIADTNYIITVDILGNINYLATARVPFIGFLIFQLLSWIIIFIKSKPIQNDHSFFILYLPVILIISIIFTIFFLANLTLTIQSFSFTGLCCLLESILQVIDFVFALLCLAIAINTQIRFIAAGYLFIMAGSFFAESNYLIQNLLPLCGVEIIWFLGLLLIAFGINDILKNLSNLKMDKWLNNLNSVQAQCAFWGFVLCMLLLTAFCGILIGYNLLKMLPLQYLPSILIMFSILTVLTSSILARILSAPFERVETVIDSYMNEEEIDIVQGKNNIYEFKRLESFLAKSFEVLKEKNKARVLFECATQVAHDIRSPLTSLNMISNILPELPEEKRILIRNAVQHINDIANNLLVKYTIREKSTTKIEEQKHLKAELVSSLLDHLISEKRDQMLEKSIELVLETDNNAYSCFVNLEPGKFKRVISNLINNASEAIESSGIIRVVLEKDSPDNSLSCEEEHYRGKCSTVVPTVFTQARRLSHINNELRTTNYQPKKVGNFNGDMLTIKIIDNGKGIPEDILLKIRQGEITSSKKEGHGLGISSAIQNIKSWSGIYDIQSKVGEGTTFIIKLPIAQAPNWFQNRLDIVLGMNVIVLDDDQLIHDVWEFRFQEYVKNDQIALKHFHTPPELIEYCLATQEQQHAKEGLATPTCPAEAKSEDGSHTKAGQNLPTTKILFLIDYELLGCEETGLDLVEKLNLKNQSILVTSRYEEPAVRNKITNLGIKIIPKNFAPYINIIYKA